MGFNNGLNNKTLMPQIEIKVNVATVDYKTSKKVKQNVNQQEIQSYTAGVGFELEPTQSNLQYRIAGPSSISHPNGFMNGGLGVNDVFQNEADKGDQINLDELQKYIQSGEANTLSYL